MPETLALMAALLLVASGITLAALAVLAPNPHVRRRARDTLLLLLTRRRS